MPRSVTTEIFLHNFPRVTCWMMHISGGPLQRIRSRVAFKPRTAFPRCTLKVKAVLRPWRKQLAWTPPLQNNAVLQLFWDAALCSKKEWVVQATKPLFPFKEWHQRMFLSAFLPRMFGKHLASTVFVIAFWKIVPKLCQAPYVISSTSRCKQVSYRKRGKLHLFSQS